MSKPDLGAIIRPGEPAMVAEPIRHRFTLDEYRTMVESGILTADDRTELIEGEIWEMAAIGSRHASSVKRLNRLFAPLSPSALLSVQDPVDLDAENEVQPDFALLRTSPSFYLERHPGPAEVLLIIEVADSTLGFDRGTKARLYARAGIAELWIFDLAGRALEVHRDPGPNSYATIRRLRPGERIAPLAFPSFEIDPADVLG